eukprot:g1241.t1
MQSNKPESHTAYAEPAVPMAQPVDVSDHSINTGYVQPVACAYPTPPQVTMAQQGFAEPVRQGFVQPTIPVVQGVVMPCQPAIGQPGLALPPTMGMGAGTGAGASTGTMQPMSVAIGTEPNVAAAGRVRKIEPSTTPKNLLIAVLTLVAAILVLTSSIPAKSWLTCTITVRANPAGVIFGSSTVKYDSQKSSACSAAFDPIDPNTAAATFRGFQNCTLANQFSPCAWYEGGEIYNASRGTPKACTLADNQAAQCGCGLPAPFNFVLNLSLSFLLTKAEFCSSFACGAYPGAPSSTPVTCTNGALSPSAITQLQRLARSDFPVNVTRVLAPDSKSCAGLGDLQHDGKPLMSQSQVDGVKKSLLAFVLYPAVLLLIVSMMYAWKAYQKRSMAGCSYCLVVLFLVVVSLQSAFLYLVLSLGARLGDYDNLTLHSPARATPAGEFTFGSSGNGNVYSCEVGLPPKLMLGCAL